MKYLAMLLLFLSSVNVSAEKIACLPSGYINADGRELQVSAGTLLKQGVKPGPLDTVYYLFSPRTLSGLWEGGKTSTFAGVGTGKLTLIDTNSDGWEEYRNNYSNVKVMVNRDRTLVQHTITDRSQINTTMYQCIKK